MTVSLAFQISLYLLIVDGLAALALAGLIEPAWWPFVGLVVAASWLHEAVRARVVAVVQRRQLLTLLAIGFFVLDLLYLAESLLDGFVHLLLFALFYKLYTRRTLKDSRDLLLLSFFMLVASSALTVSVGFLLILVVFLVVGTWTFLLYHLMGEVGRYAPQQAAALIESRDLVTPSLLELSVAASGVSFLLALAFFFVIPRVGQAVLPLRAKLGQVVSGFSERVELGSFGTIQTDASVVMRVEFPGGPSDPEALPGLRWRGIAFDHWSGREWRVTRPERRVIRRSAGGQVLISPPGGTGLLVTQEIYLEPLGSEVLFAAPRLLGLAVSAGSVWVDALDSASSPSPQARLHYRALSELEAPGRRLGGPVRSLSDEERARYLQLPPLSPRIHALARKVTRDSPDPWTAALRLTHYLQATLRYSLDLTRPPDTDPLEDFLFGSRSGNCEYFATSLAVLLRTLGIPSRVVNGFQRGEWNPYGGYFAVSQRDAHSWVEAYLPERGWVTLDPSPRAGFDAARGSSAAFQYIDALRMRWHRYVVTWSLGDQLRVSWSARQRALAWGRAAFKGRLQFPGGKRGVAVVVAVVVLLAGAVLLWRRGPAVLPVPTRRRATVLVYQRMLKRLARVGLRPGRGETAREFCLRAAGALPRGRDAIGAITRAYEEVRFGGARLAPEELARLGRLADLIPRS